MLIASSATGRNVFGTRIGDTIPMLTVNDSEKAFSLSSLRGQYVLLSFWTSTDASSREAVNRYDKALRAKEGSCGLAHVSVNLDSSTALFREIAKIDGLDMKAQFGAQSSNPEKIMADFALEKGLGTYLIDPKGKIIAFNPEIANLNF